MKLAHSLLIDEAKRWIGTKEEGGDNRGATVEMFQRAVDGKASQESWCMCFVQYCIKAVEGNSSVLSSKIFRSESCQLVFEKSTDLQVKEPFAGCVVVWAHFKNGVNTGLGHAGILTQVSANGMLYTIEGNTSDGAGIDRNGDGVYERIRVPSGTDSFRILGFIDPWKT